MASSSPPPSSANTTIPTLHLPASCNPPSETNPSKQAVWIIFGATGHIGRSLVRTALSHGDKVTAVGRTFEHSISQMQGWHERCLGMLCDVRVRETVDTVIKRSIEHWGRVDVIANCTGHGLIAAAEDQTPSDLQSQFSTNFLGTLHILQLSLPYFRTNKIPGRYLILSSTAGSLGIPGMAPYCATKYAVEGLIESLLYEVNVWGIRATLVEPGHLRNDDAEADSFGVAAVMPKLPPSLQQPPLSTQSQHPHQQSHDQAQQPVHQHGKLYGHFSVKPLSPDSAYASPHSPAMHAKRTFQWLETRQPTSAVRAAELVWQLAHCSYPPLRLLLGHFAVESVRDRLRSVTEEIEEWKDLSFGERGSDSGRKGSAGDAKVEGSGEGDNEDDGDEDGEHGEEQDDEHGDDDDGGGDGQGYGDEMAVDSNDMEAVKGYVAGPSTV